ncbi:hypothetical protein SAMN04489712_107155 [Thermomonospora echinospora]|uniref:Uncharacterized protein n=1 Tax=Thermomonospora echinospora TaxID=1992 RepID=A0A1H6BJ39_9ACTN|nr:hypothetical protein SAMN04489712_107155 [Thermomonospora echinospora]
MNLLSRMNAFPTLSFRTAAPGEPVTPCQGIRDISAARR